jgi:hypothetical protein
MGCATPAQRGICRYQKQDSVQGVERADIQCGMESNLTLLSECYEKHWPTSPKLSEDPMRIQTQFEIQPNGRVRKLTLDPVPANPEFAACMTKAIMGTQFPRHRTDGVKVTYPFVFRKLGSVGKVGSGR